ncbi:MAG: TolC family protein, partial [Bacteroidales bacterium]|nr:TolC family protein [Bacteroidales bacterium]
MKMIQSIGLAALVLCGAWARAQEQPFVLTLQQAQEYALQHNKTLLNAKDQELVARRKYLETLTSGLPQVKSGLDYTTYFNKEIEIDFGGMPMAIEMEDAFSGNIQLSQLIFSGQYIAGI